MRDQDALAAALHVRDFGKQPKVMPCGHIEDAQDVLAALTASGWTLAPVGTDGLCPACQHDMCGPSGCAYVYSGGEPCNCDPAQRARIGDGHGAPGEPHRYSRPICIDCGQHGTVRVSIEPEREIE